MAERALSGRLDRMVDTILARGDATAALQDPELAPFAGLVVEMRHYPNPRFTARLKARLKERTTMSTAVATSADDDPGPRGLHDDHALHPGAATPGSPSFLKQVFGAVETETTTRPQRRAPRAASWRLDADDGRERSGGRGAGAAEPRITSTSRTWTATFARALAAGGTSMGEPADRPYGERSGYVRTRSATTGTSPGASGRRRCRRGCAPSRRTSTRRVRRPTSSS